MRYLIIYLINTRRLSLSMTILLKIVVECHDGDGVAAPRVLHPVHEAPAGLRVLVDLVTRAETLIVST